MHGASPVKAGFYGFLFGFIGWIGSTIGLMEGLLSYVQLSHIEAFFYMVAFCIYLALPYGFFGWFYGTFQWMDAPHGAFITAACLSIFVSIIPSPIPVGIAHSLYEFPLFTQILDIGGVPLLLFALTLLNWLLVDLVLRSKKSVSVKSNVAAIAVLFTLVTCYGVYRLHQFGLNESARGDRDNLTVASIQPNIQLPHKLGESEASRENPIHVLLQMSQQAVSKNPRIKLVVWPEIPKDIYCNLDPIVKGQLNMFTQRHKLSFLINCEQKGLQGAIYNAALFIPPDGKVAEYYKQKLFPFAEYLPGEKTFPILRSLLPNVSRFTSGKHNILFRVKNNWLVFAPICYEILFSSHVRDFVVKGGNLLVNPANDAWFGTSRIPDFLIAASVFQSIQNRIPSVRISNSGNSVFIKASGEFVSGTMTKNFERKITISQLSRPKTVSPFVHYSNWFLNGLILVWVFVLYYTSYLHRKGAYDKTGI